MKKGCPEQKTRDSCIGEQEGEMAAREAGYWDGKEASISRAIVSDSGESSHPPIEHL